MQANNLKADFTTHHVEGIAREGGVSFNVPLISHIQGNLWQGGCIDGVSLGGQFKHVISLYPWERYNPGCELDTFMAVRLLDSGTVPNVQQLYALANIVNVCQTLGPTLVHCQAGLNRSGLVAALAMIFAGATPKNAIALLRLTRSPAVLCNKAFEAWLLARTNS